MISMKESRRFREWRVDATNCVTQGAGSYRPRVLHDKGSWNSSETLLDRKAKVIRHVDY
jgi:hypothetical protein